MGFMGWSRSDLAVEHVESMHPTSRAQTFCVLRILKIVYVPILITTAYVDLCITSTRPTCCRKLGVISRDLALPQDAAFTKGGFPLKGQNLRTYEVQPSLKIA